MQIEISYRGTGPCWPFERPDQTDIVPREDEAATRDAIKAEGGVITGSRVVSWQESLARVENNPDF